MEEGGDHSRAVALPASLPGCLSVSSASLPPYTLSHFSPMSLPDQGGGGIKKDREERGRERKRRKAERERRRKDRLRPGRKRWKQDPREDDDDEDTDAGGEYGESS